MFEWLTPHRKRALAAEARVRELETLNSRLERSVQNYRERYLEANGRVKTSVKCIAPHCLKSSSDLKPGGVTWVPDAGEQRRQAVQRQRLQEEPKQANELKQISKRDSWSDSGQVASFLVTSPSPTLDAPSFSSDTPSFSSGGGGDFGGGGASSSWDTASTPSDSGGSCSASSFTSTDPS